MFRMYKVILFLFMLLNFTLASAEESDLSVKIHGIKPAGGTLLVALFQRGEGWLEIDKAYRLKRVPVTGDAMEFLFESIETGEYGVYVFHDENNNNKFDMRWFPWPRPIEGAGVSGNNRRNGPPLYEDAKFSLLEAEGSLEIKIIYY